MDILAIFGFFALVFILIWVWNWRKGFCKKCGIRLVNGEKWGKGPRACPVCDYDYEHRIDPYEGLFGDRRFLS